MNEELRLELLERRVCYAAFLLGMVRGELVLLSQSKRAQLASALTNTLEAIAEADKRGAG